MKSGVCVVKGCGNTSEKNPTISFFQFSKRDPELLKLWVAAAGIDGNVDISNKKNTICSDHFDGDFFELTKYRRGRRLKALAVPTLKLPQNVIKLEDEQDYELSKESEPPDFDKICRICMSEAENFRTLFVELKKGKLRKMTVAEMITSCTGVKIEKDDELPQNICNACLFKALVSYTFKIRCETTKWYLTNLNYDARLIAKQPYNQNNQKNEPFNLDKSDNESETSRDNCKILNLDEKLSNDNANFGNLNKTNQSNGVSDENHAESPIDIKRESSDLDNFKIDNSPVVKVTRQSKNGKTKRSMVLSAEIDCVENPKVKKSKSVEAKSLALIKSTLAARKKRTVNNKAPFTCYVCLKVSNTGKEHRAHMVSSGHVTKYADCPKCGKNLLYRYMRHHLQTHEGVKAYKCFCGAGFSLQDNLRRHQRIHSNEKPHKCDICQAMFSRSDVLKEHLRKHTDDRFRCSLCGTGFRTRSELHDHRVEKHKDSPVINTAKAAKIYMQPVSCELCQKMFCSRGSLRQHQTNLHAERKEYLCSVCGQAFPSNQYLVTHLTKHNNEKPFACKLCTKTFRKRQNYRLHLRSHTGERPYSCSVCDKAFTQWPHLKRHSKLHQGIKEYECSTCHKQFTDKANLIVHQRIHTEETPFPCEFCPRAFRDSSSRRRHQSSHLKY